MAWRLDGIDIAHPYQYTPTPVDWGLVPDLELVSHKATEGTTYTDPMFSHAWAALRAKGTRYRVAYHWIRPDSDVIAQADHFIDVLIHAGGLIRGELAQLDIETTYRRFLGINIPMRPIIAPEIRAWADRVNEWAQRPVVIRYQNKHDATWDDPSLADILRWQADYTSAPTVPGVAVRQWSSTQYVSGIVNRLDANQIEDRGELDRLCGYATEAAPAPAPPQEGESVETVILVKDMPTIMIGNGNTTSKGVFVCHHVEWLPNIAYVGAYLDAGCPTITLNKEDFKNVSIDQLPGDPGWAVTDFRRVG